MIVIYVTILLLLIYSILIIYYARSWKSIPDFMVPGSFIPTTRISIIIPARNEEKNIGACLHSIVQLTYPSELLEIIIVNDHSTDRTAEIVQSFNLPNFKLINMQEEHQLPEAWKAHKKKAIETGIAHSSGELIITTDADCFFNREWVNTIACFYEQEKPVFIAAPVALHHENSFLKIFQSLDFLSLQGITGAAVHRGFHTMCNGANLAYEKKVFHAVGGFSGVDHIASGDDMLLMHKIYLHHPDKIRFIKSPKTIVQTNPVESIKEFFQQRIRWASKAPKYNDKKILGVLLIVFLLNFFLLMLLIFSFFVAGMIYWFAGIVLVKFIIELIFMIPVARFFSKTRLLWFFLPSQPFHIVYTIVAGFFGQTGSYMWKGRRVK